MADDLNDDWWEERVPEAAAGSDDDGEAASGTSEAGRAPSDDGAAPGGKRKRAPGMVYDGSKGVWVQAVTPLEAKRAEAKRARRREERRKRSKAFEEKQASAMETVRSGHGLELVNDVLAKELGAAGEDGGAAALSEEHFAPPPAKAGGVGAAVTAAFPGGLESLRALPERAGAPLVVAVVQSAARAVETLRALGELHVGRMAKLFGKHKHAAEQAKFLQTSRVSCAVGTPARLLKLANEGALSLDECALVVLEATFRDAKKRTLFEVPESRRDLAALLAGPVATACKAGTGLKILLV